MITGYKSLISDHREFYYAFHIKRWVNANVIFSKCLCLWRFLNKLTILFLIYCLWLHLEFGSLTCLYRVVNVFLFIHFNLEENYIAGYHMSLNRLNVSLPVNIGNLLNGALLTHCLSSVVEVCLEYIF